MAPRAQKELPPSPLEPHLLCISSLAQLEHCWGISSVYCSVCSISQEAFSLENVTVWRFIQVDLCRSSSLAGTTVQDSGWTRAAFSTFR